MGSGANPGWDSEGLALCVRDLLVKGAGDRRLLEVAALDLAPGDALVVRGPSGAGKSTFLFALAGLMAVAGGSIRWGGVEITALSDRASAHFRRQSIGMVFQDHLLFEELSALANATLPAAYAHRSERAGIKARGATLLDRLGLGAGAIDTATGSGGERQRIAIARAMATDPAVLLADEPTASLDRRAADRVIDDLFGYTATGRTLIIASHDPAIHARAGRLASVVDGKLRVAPRV